MKAESRANVVRISRHAHELLRKLAREEDVPMQSVLDKALERYRRERFVREANADYAALKLDRTAWKQETRERAAWEQTLADGLDNK